MLPQCIIPNQTVWGVHHGRVFTVGDCASLLDSLTQVTRNPYASLVFRLVTSREHPFLERVRTATVVQTKLVGHFFPRASVSVIAQVAAHGRTSYVVVLTEG